MRAKIYTILTLNHVLSVAALVYGDLRLLGLTFVGWIAFGKIGGEIGLHRYFAHRSFATGKFVERTLAFLACFNFFGPPLSWAAIHRFHHRVPDREGDPHGVRAWWRTWLTLWPEATIDRAGIQDLTRDPLQRWLYRNYFLLVAAVVLLVAAVNPWAAVFLFSIPAVITFHSAGMVNTICHSHGYRNFETEDRSHNNTWVNLITLGSGLHNNHHARPSAHSNKIRAGELDFPGWMIEKLFLLRKAESPLDLVGRLN